MSWVKDVAKTGEVFDETADELALQSKEWFCNMKKRVRDGYVDGVTAGEEAMLQTGFNQGFREGAARTVAVGRLKGIVSAICCWCKIQHPESPVPACVTELLQRVSQHEEKILDGIKKAMESPPPHVDDVLERMEDLEVEQAARGSCGEGCEGNDCCRRGEKMDLDTCQQPQKLSSGLRDNPTCSGEDLNVLLQHCEDVVSELGLPQELVHHIRELKNLQ